MILVNSMAQAAGFEWHDEVEVRPPIASYRYVKDLARVAKGCDKTPMPHRGQDNMPIWARVVFVLACI